MPEYASFAYGRSGKKTLYSLVILRDDLDAPANDNGPQRMMQGFFMTPTVDLPLGVINKPSSGHVARFLDDGGRAALDQWRKYEPLLAAELEHLIALDETPPTYAEAFPR